jgi:pyruvate,water dikinase
MTMLTQSINDQLHWFLGELGGDLSDFDPTLHPIIIVQGRAYGNMTFYARNMSAVLPTDQAAIGVPPEVNLGMSKVPLRRMALLPFRFYRTYQWVVRYCENDLPALSQQMHQIYHQLHANPPDPLPLVWPLFEPDFMARYMLVDCVRIVAAVMVMALDSILRKQAPELLGLFAGMETTTSLIGQQIWELRQTAERCGPTVCQKLQAGVTDIQVYAQLAEAAPLVQELRAFLQRYGHRGFEREADFESERMVDHPELVLLAVASQLRESQPPNQRTQAAQQPARQALQSMNPLWRSVWQRALGWGQRMISLREEFKSNFALGHAMYGQAARHLARHFYPQKPDDTLFFYTWDELLAFAQSRGKQRIPDETLERRRADLKLHRAQPDPPELVWFNPETQLWRLALAEDKAAAVAVTTSQLRGIPASGGAGGAVEGIAVVTNDPIEAGRRLLALKGPAVLVTHMTDPAWSSLFARLSAVVTELGGVISHAAIVARENGLPAVVGVAEATHRIRDGQRLRVNGAAGIIDILE